MKLSVKAPRLDWGGVKHSDVGQLVDIMHDDDSEFKLTKNKRNIPINNIILELATAFFACFIRIKDA